MKTLGTRRPGSSVRRAKHRGGKLAGFTMIEVLVALIVLSLGLLGLASLQVTTTKFNHSAYLRSQATRLAYSMADRMRANRAAALENNAYSGVNFVANPACGAVAGGTVAERDISAWRNALACSLPSGNGRIEFDAATEMVTISVRWDDTRGEEDPETFAMTTRL